VRHAVSHTAGVPGIRSRELAADELLDARRMAAAVAAEAPFWPPGEVACYHALTYGWIAAELVHRIDGRPAGRYFAEELAEPLGLEAWIGLPAELEERVAPFVRAPGFGEGAEPVPPELRELERAVWGNPPITGGALDWNSRAVHAAGIPGAGAIADARSMARFYSCLATGGEGLLAPETIALGSRRLSYSIDPLSGKPTTHGVGFQVQSERRRYGPPEEAFGHDGAGGSVHGAWPGLRTGFSYVMNELRDDDEDPRSLELLRVLYECVTRGA
jgi:CubicO group peptidase (beta-lactamase class C family)